MAERTGARRTTEIPAASHAINGEYPARIAERAGAFWDQVDARLS